MQYIQQQVAWGYVNRIRNKAKRAYAVAYIRSCVGFDPEPENPTNLSVMARQAVRMRIDEILER